MDLQTPANLPTPDMPSSPPVPPVASPVPPPIQAMPVQSAPADDMFSGVDKAAPAPASAPSAPQPAPPSPIAPQRVLSPLPEPHHPPVLHYVLIALAVVVVLGVIAGSVWFFAIRRPARQVMETLPVVPEVTTSTSDVAVEPLPVSDEPIGGTEFGEPEEIPSKPVITPPEGTNIPAPTLIDPNASAVMTASSTMTMQSTGSTATSDTAMTIQPATPSPADTDGDGLSDSREIELGTNPNLADTDSDSLMDGAEVLSYRTNPLVPDTDGDGYPDGVEVQKSFNPLGPGKCANPACTL